MSLIFYVGLHAIYTVMREMKKVYRVSYTMSYFKIIWIINSCIFMMCLCYCCVFFENRIEIWCEFAPAAYLVELKYCTVNDVIYDTKLKHSTCEYQTNSDTEVEFINSVVVVVSLLTTIASERICRKWCWCYWILFVCVFSSYYTKKTQSNKDIHTKQDPIDK